MTILDLTSKCSATAWLAV